MSAVNATASLGATVYAGAPRGVVTAPSASATSGGRGVFVPSGLLAPPIITLLIQNTAASSSGKNSSESFYAAAAYAATNSLSPASFTAVASANLAQAAEGQTTYFGALGAASGTRTEQPTAQENTLAAATLNAPTSEFAALAQADLTGNGT